MRLWPARPRATTADPGSPERQTPPVGGGPQPADAPRANPFLSLSAKTFYVMTFLVLISLGANAWQSTTSFGDLLQKSVEGDMIIQAREASRGLEDFLDGVVARLSVAAIPRLLEADQSLVAVQGVVQEADGRLVPQAVVMTPDKDSPAFGDVDPDELAGGLAARAQAWLATELARQGPHDRPFLRNVSAELGLPVLLVGVPFNVKDSQARLWQMVLVWQANAAAPLAVGERASSFVVDETGRLITSPAIGDLTKDTTPGTSAAKSLLQDALSRHVQAGFGTVRGATPQFAAYARLPRFAAVAVVLRDAGLVEQAVRSIVMRSLLWSWLFVLVAVMLSFLSSRRVTRTVRQVTAATHKISSGDFSSKIAIHGRDEVALMGASVNRMSSRIVELLRETERKAVLEHELETAQLLQKTFFPKGRLLPTTDCGIHGFYEPAEKCSGDWWTHFPCGEGQEFICVGDVMGHGAASALVTAMAYTMSRVFRSRLGAMDAGEARSPASLLRWMNDVLTEALEGSITMTIVAMVLDTNRGTLTYATAAHTPPLLLRRPPAADDWSPQQLRPSNIGRGGQPLGLATGYDYGDTVLALVPGDRIVLYTDGLVECGPEGGKAWGTRRFFKSAVKHAELSLTELVECLVRDAKAHCAGTPLQDDITMVAIDYARDAAMRGAA